MDKVSKSYKILFCVWSPANIDITSMHNNNKFIIQRFIMFPYIQTNGLLNKLELEIIS